MWHSSSSLTSSPSHFSLYSFPLPHPTLILSPSLPSPPGSLSHFSFFPPSQISQMGEKRFENPQTANLNKVLEDSIAIHELMVERQQQEQGARAEGETPKRTLVGCVVNIHRRSGFHTGFFSWGRKRCVICKSVESHTL